MGTIFALLAALLLAIYNLVVSLARPRMDPGAGFLLALLVNVAANLLWIQLPLPGSGAPGAAPSVILLFVLAGLFTTLIGRWLLYLTVFALGPSPASAWRNVSPVYTLILGALFLHEPLTMAASAGVAAALAGLWLMAREQQRGHAQVAAAAATDVVVSRSAQLGILYGIGSGLSFACGVLLRRAGLLVWPDATWGSAIGSLAALAGWLPVSLARGQFRLLVRTRGAGLLYWAAAGLLISVSQLCTFLALRLLPASTTQVVASIEPAFTMLFSWLLLGGQEKFTSGVVAAIAAICLGVVLVLL